jgi:signal transduction histidine kinase
LLQNLIANGLKFHHPGTSPVVRLTARTVREPGMITDNSWTAWHEISVKDNGIGFEEIYLDRIFQVFQRLRGRSEYEGSGMGLAICRKIVERHMGRITARSSPGKGSTFIVMLPAELNGGDVNGSTDHS